jgi:hypothetical protein
MSAGFVRLAVEPNNSQKMYASTAVCNDSAGISQAYVNQALAYTNSLYAIADHA